ncbi:MAG: polynucleotide adenylyltransferase PcnB [Agarilytica sp.]
MLKKLYQLFKPEDSQAPTVVHDSDHQISEADISKNAVRVVEQLNLAGHAAYLVGGCVRDALLDGDPKDFDVATDATPEQVQKTFRNARIIGRRFRIVHVRFGREIIEVTTFRGSPNESSKKNHNKKDHNQTDKGILLRDNVYGDIRSDALRRDFTVNALYYAPGDGAILDYTNGLADIDARKLRLIGDPDARYKEDPVRMLRAVRFGAKLGFTLTPETEAPIFEHADYLDEVPAARRFEEVLKLFLSGYATAVLTKLREYGLLKYLFPSTDEALEADTPYAERLVFAMAANTDKRLRSNKRVTPAFIYAAMLWPSLTTGMEQLIRKRKLNPHEAMQQAATEVINQQLAYTSIPKRFLIPMREIWSLQQRLGRRDGRRAFLTMEHPRFRAAYDFLLLREDSGEKLDGLGLWWTRFQDADEEGKQSLVNDLPKTQQSKNRRRKRKPRGSAANSAGGNGQNTNGQNNNGSNQPND